MVTPVVREIYPPRPGIAWFAAAAAREAAAIRERAATASLRVPPAEVGRAGA